MSAFSAVKRFVSEYLGMYTPPVPPLCGRCGQPRSVACGDDFLSVTDPLFPRLAGGPAVKGLWDTMNQQITTTAEVPESLLRNVDIGHQGLGLQPTYYTAHPDGLYRVADPQPVLVNRREK